MLASRIPSPTSINATANLVIGWHAVRILVGQGRLEVMLFIKARRTKIVTATSVSVQSGGDMRLEVA